MMTLIFGAILLGHVVDVHFPTAEEHSMMERYEREKENEECEKILENPDSSLEDKIEASGRLMENGRLG